MLDDASDQTAAAADNLMALLDIPDDDDRYGYSYMSAGGPGEVKAGRMLSSANYKALTDMRDNLSGHVKSLSDMLDAATAKSDDGKSREQPAESKTVERATEPEPQATTQPDPKTEPAALDYGKVASLLAEFRSGIKAAEVA
jgi:hypothetical protein